MGAWVEVSAINRGTVPDGVANGDGGRTLDHGPDEGVGDPSDDDLVRGDGAHGHLCLSVGLRGRSGCWTYEEHAEEASTDIHGAGNNSIADAGDSQQAHDVEAAVVGLVGGPGHEDGCAPRDEPDGDGQQQGLDTAVAEGADDGGEQVLELSID